MFYDRSFPFDSKRPSDVFLKKLSENENVILTDNDSLINHLNDQQSKTFVNLHGPYFPKQAWQAILNFLRKGNGLVHLGGSPFRIPVYFTDGKWVKERAQTTYHQHLNIHEVLPVKAKPIHHLEHNKDMPLFSNMEDLFTIEETHNFVLHVTKNASIKHEMGSVGSMDVVITPLLKGVSQNGRDVAAPAVIMENNKGSFVGGRWIFINQQLSDAFWTDKGADLVTSLAHYCNNGVTEMSLKTNYATYDENEKPRLSLQIQSLKEQAAKWSVQITISKDNQDVYTIIDKIESSCMLNMASFHLPINLSPGLYHITCQLVSDHHEKRILHQGFWCKDQQLLTSGEPLKVGRDYFQKEGRPLPIVGMTYMTSDVARYFFFLPNAHLWDKDMAHMKRAGINYIRTGIWTGWRNMMFIDGHVDEVVLRSIDAFILTAKKHEIEVTFTFFTFTPETWEGVNPYLDPRSIEAQKRFVSTIVSRHRETTNVNWDLINEPSLFDPNHTFGGPRTLGDSYDRRHYQAWLKKRHGSIRELQEKWNMTEQELPAFEAIQPPRHSEINFSIRDMMSGKKGLKWVDYALYTMEMLNQWVEAISEPIKQLAPQQLITVGQDEGLAGLRPSPLFYADVIDYTSNHTWWLNDDLVWDGIFTKTPHKPNLIQETGIMYVENPNNQAKRSEEELRNILERKYAYAFSTGGAGAVQWLWNTNYFMNNINESNIGAIRADGTEKPETNVSYDFGAFMKETRDLFKNRKLEDIAVIFPFSNDFSNRRLSMASTTRLTRVLTYEMNLHFRAFSEYDIEPLRDALPKLVIVPSAHHFNHEALDKLLHIVKEDGITLLFTGPINLDEYWNHSNRMDHVLGKTNLANIVREEMLHIDGKYYPVSFGDERIADTMKEVIVGKEECDEVNVISLGKGQIIWSPLPVELNQRTEVMTALYEFAIAQADVKKEIEWIKGDYPGIYGRKLSFKEGTLFIFVSEFSLDTTIEFKDEATHTGYTFEIEKERTVMFMTDQDGSVMTTYRPDEVTITTNFTK